MYQGTMLRCLVGGFVVCTTATGVTGCQKKPQVTASTIEATVSGTVRISGKPVTAGEVVFDPANYQRRSEQSRTAPIGEDGSYTIKTLVGQNIVWVTGEQIPLERGLAYEQVVIDVKEGSNTLDIELGRPFPDESAPQ